MNVVEFCARHPLAYVLVAFVLGVVCLNAVSGATLGGMTAQTILAAVGMVVLLALGDPHLLVRRTTSTPAHHLTQKQSRRVLIAVLYLLVISCAIGIISALFAEHPPQHMSGAEGEHLVFPLQPVSLFDMALFFILCLATGVFEEALFRGIMVKGFARSLEKSSSRQPLLVAAVVSSLVFGILHIAGISQADSVSVCTMAQFIMKPLQAALFGFIMAALFVRTGNLWLIAGIHAAFNALSEAPAFALSGALTTTYATGFATDLAVLIVSAVLLVPLAVQSARFLMNARVASLY